MKIKQGDAKATLAARRERDRARRQAKRVDEVPTEEKGSCSILEHMGRGPCYHIAAVVDSLLCGLVGKIVVRREENCKRLLGDESDRADVGCGLV